MSTGPTPPEQGTIDARTSDTREGFHSISCPEDVRLYLTPVYGPDSSIEEYWVYLADEVGEDPDVEDAVELGTIGPYDNNVWYIRHAADLEHTHGEYGGFELALGGLVGMMTRIGRRWHPNEKGEAVEIVDPPTSRKREEGPAETVLDVPASEAAEEPGDGQAEDDLRDHVHVGLDLPIRVYRQSSAEEEVEWWYYVHVELPNGEDDCVGMVKQYEREDYWVAQAAPGYGTVCREDTMQEALDGLVRYALERDVKFRKDLREERIV